MPPSSCGNAITVRGVVALHVLLIAGAQPSEPRSVLRREREAQAMGRSSSWLRCDGCTGRAIVVKMSSERPRAANVRRTPPLLGARAGLVSGVFRHVIPSCDQPTPREPKQCLVMGSMHRHLWIFVAPFCLSLLSARPTRSGSGCPSSRRDKLTTRCALRRARAHAAPRERTAVTERASWTASITLNPPTSPPNQYTADPHSGAPPQQQVN